MRLEDIIRYYVSPIKRFDGILGKTYCALDIYNHYKQQVKHLK
jgi:hypothetical protein